MALDRLQVTGLRNIAQADLTPSAGINLICGANGSGKTSLLEALHLLGLARSFRARHVKSLIHFDAESLTVFGRIAGTPPQRIGIQRRRDSSSVELRLDGERVERISRLAEQLPLQLIDNHTFELIEGSPRARREYLDWGVFHLDHDFLTLWKRMRRALKHRNALLRYGTIDRISMAAWNQELGRTAEQMDSLRKQYIEQLAPLFSETLARLADLPDVTLQYTRGWERQRPLEEVLEAGIGTDRKMGFTQQGPQRADIRIRVGKRLAAEVLSRGQQKVVVSALKLAQGQLLERLTERHCLYLIDDLAAELDSRHRQRFCELLEEQQGQSFITAIERADVQQGFSKEFALFELRGGRLESA